MKLVILAAGKETRMGELTKDIPKSMLTVRGKNLIEHKLDATPLEHISEIVLVVRYLQEIIRNHFGTEYKGTPITYVEDTIQGTGKAVWNAQNILDEPFLVMNGDDVYHPDDILAIMRTKGGILLDRAKTEVKSGKAVIDNHRLVNIVEGQLMQPGEPINTGFYHLTPEVFDFELVKTQDKDEWGLPQTLIARAQDFPLIPVYATQWIQVTVPEDIQKAEKELS